MSMFKKFLQSICILWSVFQNSSTSASSAQCCYTQTDQSRSWTKSDAAKFFRVSFPFVSRFLPLVLRSPVQTRSQTIKHLGDYPLASWPR